MTAAVTNEKVREWDQSTAPYTIMILRRTDAFAAAADRDETALRPRPDDHDRSLT
jgi:hypothetical protein